MKFVPRMASLIQALHSVALSLMGALFGLAVRPEIAENLPIADLVFSSSTAYTLFALVLVTTMGAILLRSNRFGGFWGVTGGALSLAGGAMMIIATSYWFLGTIPGAVMIILSPYFHSGYESMMPKRY